MDIIQHLMTGFSVAVSPINLFYLTVGVFVGMVVGIIPGFGSSGGIAILVPLTFSLEPTTAIIMLAGIYYGAMYGGTITSILINTPGESATVAATLDGYPLAKQGKAGQVLVMQAIGSFIGGTIGVILICGFAPLLANFALGFGPPEYFMIVMIGLLMLTLMMGNNQINGIISALFGFALAMVGVDIVTGQQRFTFGSPELIGGVNFIPVAIGLFGLGELFYLIYEGTHKKKQDEIIKYKGTGHSFWPKIADYIECKFTFLRNGVLGFIIGTLPGAGATIASLMGYSFEKKVSKTPEKFGKGHMPGLVAPETANNGASSGAMVPLLTLGIPGSGSTAVLLGAFLMWGLTPGPLLMTQEPEFAWGMITSMYLGNVFLLLVNITCIPIFVKILKIPYNLLFPVVVVLCIMGTYSLNGSIIETWIMLGCGVIGFFMKMFDYSPAAVVLALVLGPMAENTLRQSIIASSGDLSIFVTRPISLTLLIIVLIIIVAPFIIKLFTSRPRKDLSEEA